MTIEDDEFFVVKEHLETFCRRLDEKIQKEQEQLKACKKKSELESKLAIELKLNEELVGRRAAAERREDGLRAACAASGGRVLAAGDRERLHSAREQYELGKQLTGVRFDFGAPQGLAKGYVCSEARRVLQPFEGVQEAAGGAERALWAALARAAHPAWPRASAPAP